MSDIINVSRRRFLKHSALVGGGLILGVRLAGAATTVNSGLAAATPSPADPARSRGRATFAPNAFVRVGSDESVTVIVNHSEMGQGTYTSIAMTVADELDADWNRVRVEAAPVDAAYNHPVYGMQMTGGSTSTWSEWGRLRQCGAAARHMLITAAATAWGVEAATCTADRGHVIHGASNRRLSYGSLVDAASKLTPPKDVALKDPTKFRLIGKPTTRVDTPDKTNGRAIFAMDINLPGCLVALVARAPVFGARLKSFDDTKARAVSGVRYVVRIDRGVAIVAEGFWAAKLGRDALKTEWEGASTAPNDTITQGQQYAELGRKPGVVARNDGDSAAALAGAMTKLEGTYDLPYLAHAPMEPMNCVADVRAESCEIWTGTQFQTVDHKNAVAASGLKAEQVKLHTTLLGGGFGRKATWDSHFVVEAVQISKAIKAPVKVIWTREDDLHSGYFRPRAHHRLRGAVNPQGTPVAWEHRVVCQSFAIGTPFEGFVVKDGVDDTAVEGANDIPYDIPNLRVEWQRAPDGVPTHFWRSVGHSHTAFAKECFIDEMAHAGGQHPLTFRLNLLGKHPRWQRILNLVAEKSGFMTPAPAGRARGIAVHEAFGSIAAHVAEVSVDADGTPVVHRVVAAIDCGPIVNPDSVRAQLESAVAFALSATLHGEMTFENGRVKQGNFHDYPVLRMQEMPKVETHIVQSTDKMGGVGEPGVPSLAPAVCNALFALTGKRIRRLPIQKEDLVAGPH